jgi:malonate-semialdehyde dehydrogenase (acetylating)/methylmalonate-semialdehyde dehydrogenase
MTPLIGHFINGQLEAGDSPRSGPVFNPSSGEEIARCAYADRATLERAVAHAQEAGRRWALASQGARLAVIFKLRELMLAHAGEFAQVIGREHGKTLADAAGEVGRAIEAIEFATNAPHVSKGEYSRNVGGEIDVFSMRVPIGVVACITPSISPSWCRP